MPRPKRKIPDPPDQPVKMLYEYTYDELPPDKKVVVNAMMKIFLNWVISNPEFWEDEQDAMIMHVFR